MRLKSLDILRGLTVAGMIVVNNGYGESYATLRHSVWNGLTLCDLVFPFFLFIMGIACYLSLSKGNFTPTKATVRKVIKRAVLLFAIGLAINWFDHAIEGHLLCFGHLRIWAVMQRIALCSLAVSLFALYANHRYTVPTIIALLVAYACILVFGNGYAEDASTNILAQADLRLFGYNHLYHKSPVDPEGLLGTISSIAHVLIGFYCGKLIKTAPTVERKTMGLFAVSAVLIIGGLLLSLYLPLNKRVWSPSYVLLTCGLCAALQAALMAVVDLWGAKHPRLMGWQTFFLVFGVNALALYVGSEVLSIVFHRFALHHLLYNGVHLIIGPEKLASLAYALTFMLINYALGYWLYKRKIFIKL